MFTNNTWIHADPGLEVYATNNAGTMFNTVIAGFDLDGTLICPIGRGKFCKAAGDWKWIIPDMLAHMRKVAAEYGRIFILTNQSQFDDIVRQRIEVVCSALSEIPVIVMVSTGYTKYRKPMRGFMDYIEGTWGTVVARGFYVGDAMNPLRGDHSTCDYYFALNAGLQFEYYSNRFQNTTVPVQVPMRSDAIKGVDEVGDNADLVFRNVVAQAIKRPVIILSGPPAAGKSTFARRLVAMWDDYTVFSMNEYSSKARYLKALEKAIKGGEQVIIDNTNPDDLARAHVTDLVEDVAKGDKVVIVQFDVSRETCQWLNHWRTYWGGAWIPDIVYNIYYKRRAPCAIAGVETIQYRPQFVITNSRQPIPYY